jgi:CheY-like chemotaxis protein
MSKVKPTILVVEDDAMVGFYLEDLLGDWGLDVLGPVASAAEAQVTAASGAFEFALLDVNLVGGTSYGAAEALARRGLPFTFITAYGAEGVRKDLRAAAVLSKPINQGELKAVLTRAGLLQDGNSD